MAVNPLLTASGQQRIPLVPWPFGPPIVDRDVLPPTVGPTDPRQFCVPSHFGSSILPNANMPNMSSNRIYSGWSFLPPESIRAVSRRNEMIRRPHAARAEIEMYSNYQQRKLEKCNLKGPGGLEMPFLYGSSVPPCPAIYQGQSMLPVSDLHFHRSTLRNLRGNPILVATGPHFIESWGQKYYRLRRGSGNQKPLNSDSESSKSQAEEKVLNQTHAIPQEEDEHETDPETEICNNQKSSKTSDKPATAVTNPCGALQPTNGKPQGAHAAPLEVKIWHGGKQKASEPGVEACDGETNRVCPPVLPLSLPGGCPGAKGRSSLKAGCQVLTLLHRELQQLCFSLSFFFLIMFRTTSFGGLLGIKLRDSLPLSHMSIAEAGLELVILLPQSPGSGNTGHTLMNQTITLCTYVTILPEGFYLMYITRNFTSLYMTYQSAFY
uniref:Sterile alpha motif domain containing 7 n=1 Tax=Spermophilus dauricus TaxID=99837 RepID=A0A8C9P8R8_SPEDA